MFPENGDRFAFSIRSNQNAIAPAFERHTRDFAQTLVIFGKQERFRATPQDFRLGLRGNRERSSGTRGRQ